MPTRTTQSPQPRPHLSHVRTRRTGLLGSHPPPRQSAGASPAPPRNPPHSRRDRPHHTTPHHGTRPTKRQESNLAPHGPPGQSPQPRPWPAPPRTNRNDEFGSPPPAHPSGGGSPAPPRNRHPPCRDRPYSLTPPRGPRSAPWHRSPLAAPDPTALHGLTWRARITDDDVSSAPVPRWTTLSNPGACSNAQRGGSLLVQIATLLCVLLLLCRTHLLAFQYSNP